MPFVSNRMNFSQVGGMVMFPVKLAGLEVQVSVAHILDGRNVGQATTSPAACSTRFNWTRS